ncbi:MAG: AI-2E family transporter [Alphaproteobacteria bacterium]
MTDRHSAAPPDPPSPINRFARRGFELAAIALGTAAGLFLVWQASNALFLVFAGLLFAVFLDACTRGLGRLWTGSRGWRLAAVCTVLALLIVTGVSFGGYTIAQQASELFNTVQDQLRVLERAVGGGSTGPNEDRGAPQAQSQPAPAVRSEAQPQGAPPSQSNRGAQSRPESDDEGGIGSLLRRFFPNAGALLRSATTALGGVTGVLGNLVVIVFLGLYVAINPGLYRRGLLLLLPRDRRERFGAVLDECADTLRWWIVGQFVSMGIIAVLTFLALTLVGMPAAFVLALITGLFAFIPYIGSFVSGVIIVLVGLANGGTMVIWALGVYVLVQLVESYILAPIVERWSVNLAPALVIGGLTVLGMLFGLWGFILAAPLLAVLQVVILRLWVADALGDPDGTKAAASSGD